MSKEGNINRISNFANELAAKVIDWVFYCKEVILSESEIHALMNKVKELRKQSEDLER